MRVFSVEMLVKEEGAAVVEAALKRLKGEANAVAAQMKVTSSQVTTTGRAMQTAGEGTKIAGDRAAKAAIGFAAVGQSMARTGSLTADAGTRIVEAGSQIATMFGPGGLAVAALLAFGASALTNFTKARDEAKKLADDLNKSVREMVTAGDTARIERRLQEVRQGLLDVSSGQLLGGLDDLRAQLSAATAELARLSDEYKSVAEFQTRSGLLSPQQTRVLSEYSKQSRAVAELRKQIADLEREEALLVRGRQLAAQYVTPAVSGGVTARTRTLGSLPKAGTSATGIGQRPEDMIEAMRRRIPQAIGPVLTDAQRSAAELAVQLEQTFAMSVSMALTTGIIAGIENAIASGNIGAGFKALTAVMLAGLGDAMVQFGVASLAASDLMDKIQKALAKFLPGDAISASIAMIGLGAALKGTARAAFGRGGGGGGGGAAFSSVSFGGASSGQTTQIIFGATSATTAAGMQPRQSMNVTIIGPNDPSAQRAMQELMAKANSRGRVG